MTGPAPTTPMLVGSLSERNSRPNTARNIKGKTKVNSSATRSRKKLRSRASERVASWRPGDGDGGRAGGGPVLGWVGVVMVAFMPGTPSR
jgi:hypothetical protein